VAARRRGEIPDVLLLVEHSPVFTVGRATKQPTFELTGSELRRRGIPVVECERGGEVTYHGPGQVVGYPIIDLRARGQDLHQYLRELEETIIITLGNMGVAARRRVGLTGVWVDGTKIASIGVAVRRWVTFHGFALNVTCDLEPFDWIVPCGLRGVTMTSLQQIRPESADMAKVRGSIVDSFCKVFKLQGQAVAATKLFAAVARSADSQPAVAQ